jgi:hypothetical protein
MDARTSDSPAYDEKKTPLERPHSNVPDIPIYNKLELASEEDLSIGAILRGTAAHPLTTFEKKAALINAEIDKFGLGKYQICIWFLCGFGYFLDLAWSQGVGLVATAIYQEMGVPDPDAGLIYTCANAGLAIGALGFGLAVDIIGRKWAFNLTCLITSVFGLLLVSLSPVVSKESANVYKGCSKIQLRRHLWHLFPCFARSWRKHPDRRDYCPRIPPPRPSIPGPTSVHVAAHWCRDRLCHCLRYSR